MSTRRALVWQIAPVAPPCWPTRLQWLEFLASAAEDRVEQVLVLEPGKPARMRASFDFCAECIERHRVAMTQAGKCRPSWLIDTLPKETTHAA